MNNWERNGFKTREEGVVHVLGFLKANEEKIMSHSVSDEAIITYGELQLQLKVKSKKKK